VQMLAKETGATAIFESSRLERAVRDMDAAVKHIAMSPTATSSRAACNSASNSVLREFDSHARGPLLV
jgi:hypothetical protein